VPEKVDSPSIVKRAWGEILERNGVNGQMKVELLPMGLSSLIMRVENIADTFDTEGEVIRNTVNVHGLARDLFRLANNGADLQFEVIIEETSLSANQSYEEMVEKKLKWKVTGDEFRLREQKQETFEAMEFQQ
jgi:hypothetical protein